MIGISPSSSLPNEWEFPGIPGVTTAANDVLQQILTSILGTSDFTFEVTADGVLVIVEGSTVLSIPNDFAQQVEEALKPSSTSSNSDDEPSPASGLSALGVALALQF